MARRRKSSPGGALAVLFLGALALLMSIPEEVWIGIGVVAAVGLLLYLFATKQKKAPPRVSAPRHPQQDLWHSTVPSPVPQAAIDKDMPARRPAGSRPAEKAPQSAPQVEPTLQQVQWPSAPSAPTPDVPVTIADPTTRPQATPTFRVPPAPKGIGKARWVPRGESVAVAGMVLPDGMVYVGTSLPTPYGHNDPCLIDPSKAVGKAGNYAERQTTYWPSYSEVSPEARRAYLSWLAGGRRDPAADVGFVFLFFYGLERRVLIDAPVDEAARAELPAIAAELRSLLGVYGTTPGSFHHHARQLLEWVELAEFPPRLYERPIPNLAGAYEVPLYLRVALGQTAVDRVPVPPHLALAWARLAPTVYLRTPARRCSDEFEKMFFQEYARQCGRGIELPHNRTKLKFSYHPASSGFRGSDEPKLTFGNIPDVTVLTGPPKKLQAVVDAATKPLESYSRLVGKDPAFKESLEAMLQLPEPLWPFAAREAIQNLRSRMVEGFAEMTFGALLAALNAKTVFTKERTLALARVLEASGIGMEPDVLGEAKPPKPEDPIVVFALPTDGGATRGSGTFPVPALTVQLASTVLGPDTPTSDARAEFLREAIRSWQHLTPGQTARLLALQRLLRQAPASMTALKKKFEAIELPAKEAIAAFVATVVHPDGEVSPAELKTLDKVYKTLGVDPKRVFSDVHGAAVGQRLSATPAPVRGDGVLKLDPDRIAALQRDTERVSALLADIFVEGEQAQGPAAAAPIPEQEQSQDTEAAPTAQTLLGLDEAHSSFARMLLNQREWSREDLLDVASDLDLMLDGALEHINDAAFDAHDMPFSEGSDPVVVNPEILEKLQA